MIKQDQSEALDSSLALLEAGSTLEECLALYPEHSDDLRPLLEIVLQMRQVPSPTPSPAAFATGKQKMLQALAEKGRRRATPTDLFSRGMGWVNALFQRYGLRTRAPAFQLTLVMMTTLMLLALVGTLLLPWIDKSTAQAATLIQVEGTVEIMPVGGDTWRPVLVGEWVKEGDRVRTHSLSAATLLFFDKSTTDMEANTEVAVTQISPQHSDDRVIVLYQALGQTYSRVQQSSDSASRFEIETPTAVTAVRGTAFALTVEADGTTRVAVAEGTVDVTTQGSTVAVHAGQETTVRADQSATPLHPVLTATSTPRFTSTPQPSETPTATGTPEPAGTPEPTAVSEPGETPASPNPNSTHQPPGLTKTPQPPGQTRTPQPPGQTRQPKPDSTKKPKPPKNPK